MTRINLLPWREALRKKRNNGFFAQLAMFIGLAAAAWGAAHVYFSGQIDFQENRNAYLCTEIAELKKIEKEIKELDKIKEQLLGRLEVVQNLQSSRPGMVHVFDDLVRLIPESIYLTSLASAGNNLTITGVANSDNVVANFMLQLEDSDWFGVPSLKQIKNRRVNDILVSDFELAVVRTAPKRPGEEEEEGQLQ